MVICPLLSSVSCSPCSHLSRALSSLLNLLLSLLSSISCFPCSHLSRLSLCVGGIARLNRRDNGGLASTNGSQLPRTWVARKFGNDFTDFHTATSVPPERAAILEIVLLRLLKDHFCVCFLTGWELDYLEECWLFSPRLHESLLIVFKIIK